MPNWTNKKGKSWSKSKPRPKHKDRGNDPFYKSYKWTKLRKELFDRWHKEHLTAAMELYQDHNTAVTLEELNEFVDSGKPLCVECQKMGRLRVATVCDHITPRINGGAEYAESNLQPLCSSHHNKKSAKERK